MRKCSCRLDMHRHLRCSELTLDRRFDCIGEPMCFVDWSSARNRDGHLSEKLPRRRRARAHTTHVAYVRHTEHDATQASCIDRSLVDEDRNRIPEDFETAPGDDQRHDNGEERVESRPTNA